VEPENRGSSVSDLEAELEQYRRVFAQVVDVCSQAAQGNLEARLIRCEGSEHLKLVARSVNHLLDMTDAFLREAEAALDHASQGLFFRRVLLRGMRGTFRHKAQLINDATERLGRNANSLKEVQRLIVTSAEIAQDAVKEAREASTVVQQLGESSVRIGNVTKSISQIAWQTRLLSFNAKIEASRAGDAGRGFDVVAGEVKALAQQTATDTDAIAREIATMQHEAQRTSAAIEAVRKTIENMQEISLKIERAVVEQNQSSSQAV
jgi:methyl-accepting chemotaxis protein